MIFSNAAFVGRPETGMRYYNSRRDSKSTVYDHYTGVGEVLAIHALDEAFGALGQKIRVKRGSLFSLDDVKNNNLIFVGSPSENLSLLDIPNTAGIRFSARGFGAAPGRSFDRQQKSEAGRGQHLPRQSFWCFADGRLLGHRTGAGNGIWAVRDDSGGNDHFRYARRSGICLPPGDSGETAA